MLNGIKSHYILKKLIQNINPRKYLKIFKYNKELLNRLDIPLKVYKDFLKIEIEITINTNVDHFYNKKKLEFINYVDKKSYYHIYFGNDQKNKKRNYITKNENVSKIRIVLDKGIKTLKQLFCDINVDEINFIKFFRKDITNMNSMFKNCGVNKLNLSNLNTENIIDMGSMFSCCFRLQELKYMDNMFCNSQKLKNLDLSNFDTSNVTDMSFMFASCIELKKLNIKNFNTSNVTNMRDMFSNCKSLKELDIKNFNTENVENFTSMFSECKSLINLDISHFKLDKVLFMDYMFSGCNKKFKEKIRNQINLKEEAFYKEFYFYYDIFK